jgi:hypothetical protein
LIPKVVVLDIAQKVGFGGAQRPKLYPQLQRFADGIAAYQRDKYAAMCTEQGHVYSAFRNEFMDGKMDGAFMCAEMILGDGNASS